MDWTPAAEHRDASRRVTGLFIPRRQENPYVGTQMNAFSSTSDLPPRVTRPFDQHSTDTDASILCQAFRAGAASMSRTRSVLLTGGAGFIGSRVVDYLLKQGHNVCVVDNFDPFYDPSVKHQFISGYQDHPGFEFVETDIRDYDALSARLGSGFDTVVHLAARAGVRPSIDFPRDYESVNIQGTQNLLELAREWGTRQFVFASSSSVYGVSPNVPWREDEALLRPISPYAATKMSGELLGHVYSHLFDMRFIALRFFTVYGPRQRPDLAIHKFARLMLEDKPIPFYGDGSTRRDYTYIDDIAEGVVAAMQYDQSPYEVFNLGNNRTVSLREMVDCLECALGRKASLQRLPAQPGDVPQTWADLKKSHHLLGYNPCTDFEVGMTRFVEWLT